MTPQDWRRWPLVYVAGPYGSDPVTNTRTAMGYEVDWQLEAPLRRRVAHPRRLTRRRRRS